MLALVDAREEQLRVGAAEAEAAIAAVRGMTAVAAVAKLRLGPGRTCEPVARLIDRALAGTQVDPHVLVVAGGSAVPAPDIVRVRRKAHGTADWISTVTAEVRIELRPVGIYRADESTVDVPVSEPPVVADAGVPVPRAGDPHCDPHYDAHCDQHCAAVREALYEVLDPDLGVNIVDLGFVRGIAVSGATATITMTLTSPACPLTAIMEDQIRAALLGADGPVSGFRVDWQWLPSWRPTDISEDGREQLRAIGFNHF
jgi:metal-sulfur cluster biosynthetic enzyme/ribosomal protein L22